MNQNEIYVGARYVPVFADDPWSNEREYEPLTVVLHEGSSYTSRQFVPEGIDIGNELFWARTGDYNAQVDLYREETRLKPFAFNTVADMQNCTVLFNGAICHTNGFHSAGDGGAAWYVISNSGSANGMNVIGIPEVEPVFFASLVVTGDSVTPEMFGAWGDGTNDDTIVLNYMFSLAETERFLIILNKIYLVSETINVYGDVEQLSDSFIKANNALDYIALIRPVSTATDTRKYNHRIKLQVDGNGIAINGIGIGYISHSQIDVSSKYCKEKCINTGYVTSGNDENDINCYFIGNNDGSTEIGVFIHGADNNYQNIMGFNAKIGVEIDSVYTPVENIHCWQNINTNEFYIDSCCVKLNPGGFLQCSNLYCDSMNYAIYTRSNDVAYAYVNTLNMLSSQTLQNINLQKILGFYTPAPSAPRSSFITFETILAIIGTTRIKPIWDDIISSRCFLTIHSINDPIGSIIVYDSPDILPTTGIFIATINGSNKTIECKTNNANLITQEYIDWSVNQRTRYSRIRAPWNTTWGQWISANYSG